MLAIPAVTPGHTGYPSSDTPTPATCAIPVSNSDTPGHTVYPGVTPLATLAIQVVTPPATLAVASCFIGCQAEVCQSVFSHM